MFAPTAPLDIFVHLTRRYTGAPQHGTQAWSHHHHIAHDQRCSERYISGGTAGFVEFSEAPWTQMATTFTTDENRLPPTTGSAAPATTLNASRPVAVCSRYHYYEPPLAGGPALFQAGRH